MIWEDFKYFNGIIGSESEQKWCKEFDEASKRKLSNEQEFVETVNKGELIKYLYSLLQFFDFACSLLRDNEGISLLWSTFYSGTTGKFADTYRKKLLVCFSYIYSIFFVIKMVLILCITLSVTTSATAFELRERLWAKVRKMFFSAR